MDDEYLAFDANRETAQCPAGDQADDDVVDGDCFLAMGYPEIDGFIDEPRSPIALPFDRPPGPERPCLPADAARAPPRGSGDLAASRLPPAAPVIPFSPWQHRPPPPPTVRGNRDAFPGFAARDPPAGGLAADPHLVSLPGGARAPPWPDHRALPPDHAAAPPDPRPFEAFVPAAGEGARTPRRASAALSSSFSSSTTVGGVDAAGDRRSRKKFGTVNRTMSMRGSRARVAKVRVVNKTDSKSYFSVERTMYQWIYMSTVILGYSLTFYAVAHPDPAVMQLVFYTASLLSGLSLVVVYYAAVYAFRRRRALDRKAGAAAFDDRAGPIAVVTMTCSVFIVYVVLATRSIFVNLHKTSFGLA